MSSAYDVRRVVAALLWPTDPIYQHSQLARRPGPAITRHLQVG
jgi:hypothetical protein